MCSPNGTSQITPDTKIGEMLASHPDLEPKLAELAPSYGALQSPQLRQSVARNTSLAQVAQADGLSIGSLVAELRTAAGLDADATDASDSNRPDWADTGQADRSLDACPIIEQGGHPLDRVMQGVSELAPGEVYELITPFVPAPLIEMIKMKGFEAFSTMEGPGECRTYFRSRSQP